MVQCAEKAPAPAAQPVTKQPIKSVGPTAGHVCQMSLWRKPAFNTKVSSSKQEAPKNNNGPWGPVFKSKENFKNMHMF